MRVTFFSLWRLPLESMLESASKPSVFGFLDGRCIKFAVLIADYCPVVLLVHRQVINLRLATSFINIYIALYSRKLTKRFFFYHLNTQSLRHFFRLFGQTRGCEKYRPQTMFSE